MKKVIVAICLLGTIGLAINLIFGWNTFTFLTPIRTENNIYLYKLDIWSYIQNLKNSFSTITNLSIDQPTRVWNNDIINNLALFLDWFLFATQIIIYPFRVGGYIVLQVLAIFGINTIEVNQAGGLKWLVLLAQYLRDMQIQYI